MLESVRAGRSLKLDKIHTIADGIAVQQPGMLNFEYVKRFVKEILTVSYEQIVDVIVSMLQDVRVVVEPAAAAAPAVLLYNQTLQNLGKKICCVITGGNIAHSLLQQVANRQTTSP